MKPYPSIAFATFALCIAAGPGSAAEHLTGKEIAESVRTCMDAKADPCQDFYRYACGGWLDTAKIPGDYPEWDRGFADITERNLAVLRSLLEEAVSKPGGDADLAKMGRYYSACVDEAAAEKAGVAPLGPMLKEIDAVKGMDGLMSVSGKLHRISASPLFNTFTAADFKDPNLEILHLYQGGLGMPDRDYYLENDERQKTLRQEYETHVGKMLALSGESNEVAVRHAKEILAFETELAKVSWPRTELRNVEKIYHKLDIAGLERLAPHLPWKRFLQSAGYPALKDISVSVPDFTKGMAAIAATTSPETLRAYLRYNLLSATAYQLSKAFVDEQFAIEAKFTGQEEVQPRWKRCINSTDGAFGELLGRYYVERQFAGDSKTKALEIIHGIEWAFEDNLPSLAWMDDTTRGRAVGKMKAISNKIGYPDKWRDYSKLDAKAGDFFGNSMAARAFEFDRTLSRVGKAVDKTEWSMSPPTVNAYYNPLVNEIVFPAGILQRPFFNRDFPVPMNYGAMGMVVGHELTHGFDDQGRKFDANGRLQEWWEPSVSAKFDERAKCVSDLYSTYEPQPGVKLNGKLTLGENIADLGGLKQAYRAYKQWVKEHGEPAVVVEGLTNEQLFFIGFAQIWCTKAQPEFERLMVTTNPHSLPKYRVNGPVSSFPEFGKAFNCSEGAPMRPAKTCEVW